MRLQVEQLQASFKKGLVPVYWIAGDEPLQQQEAADAVRLAAKAAGFTNREILTVDAHFEWSALAVAAESLSLFADKKIIDLRLPAGKPGAEGAKALSGYCEHPPDDTVLLVTSGKLEAAALKSKWWQRIDRSGVVVQVWPLTGRELLGWLQRRLQQRGMQAKPDAVKSLAARVEGNLLAAAQEIEKLYGLHGATELGNDAVEAAVADSSRYDVFNLCDYVLVGKPGRIVKVLQGLKQEGVALPIVLWALMREARQLSKVKMALLQGQSHDQALRQQRVWEKRKMLVRTAVDRLSPQQLDNVLLMGAKADRQIKGQQRGDAWETLLRVCLSLAGAGVMATTD